MPLYAMLYQPFFSVMVFTSVPFFRTPSFFAFLFGSARTFKSEVVYTVLVAGVVGFSVPGLTYVVYFAEI